MSDNDAMIFDPLDVPEGTPHGAELYKRRGVETQVTGEAAPPPSDEYIRAQSPTLMVKEVTDRITRYERQLAETTGAFDPATGEPVPVLRGPRRDAMERELHTLRHSTLPYTHIQAAEIAKAQAALPTQADKLRAEAAKRDRIQTRALELAEEAEAEALAERLRKAKRAQAAG